MRQGRCRAWVPVHPAVFRVCVAGLLAAAQGLLLAEPVSKEGATEAVAGWLGESGLRLNKRLPAQIKSVKSYPHFHVVHLAPEGYVVTAADSELEPIIAFSSHGTLVPDPNNPLWTMLNADLPARSAGLKKGLAAAHTAKNTHAEHWTHWRTKAQKQAASLAAAPRLLGPTGLNAAMGLTGPTSQPGQTNANNAFDTTPAPPVRILSIRQLNGHIEITHDALASVSVLTSYDGGRSWEVLDAGVISQVWVSKRPARELSSLFKLELDGLYDEMTIEMLRRPSLTPPTSDFMSASNGWPIPEPGIAMGLGSVADIRISPLMQTTWSQQTVAGLACYNYYCPPGSPGDPNNYPCGCVATAMGQIMRYNRFPATGYGHTYDYNSMPFNPASPTASLSQRQAIGQFLRDIGTSVSMMYGAGGSGAYVSYICPAYNNNFGYTKAKDISCVFGTSVRSVDRDLILRANMAAGYPVLLSIYANGASGHAVVTDGFGYSSGTLYYHVNLGWGGYYDAWYNLPIIDAGYAFNSVYSMIYNLFPSGPGEIIGGRVLSASGVPIQGVTVTAMRTGTNYYATTDAQGYYGVQVDGGYTYSMTATKSGYSGPNLYNVAVGTSQSTTQFYDSNNAQWGKCGSFFGADFTLTAFSVTSTPLTNTIWLRWTSPTNCGMPNETVYIRWRTDRFPTNSSDGTEIYTGTNQVYAHTVDGSGLVTNYYTVWGNNGSAYASLGSGAQTYGCADPGPMKIYWTSPAAGQAIVWGMKANGTRRFYNTVGTFSTGWTLVGTADFDGDGVADLIWQNSAAAKVAYWLMNADGTKRASGYAGDITAGWTYAGSGDIDKDGVPDLIWVNYSSGKSAYWMMKPDGTMRTSGYIGTFTSGWQLLAVGDIDKDGTTDLVWQNAAMGKVAYWFLNANGTTRSTGYVGNITTGWALVGARDIDKDGTVDLVFQNVSLSKAAYWFLNSNGTMRSSGYIGTVTPGWTLVGLGDLNADGTVDLIWQNLTQCKTAYWILNADGTMRSSGYSGGFSSGWSIATCSVN